MVSTRQVKAARALLGWSQEDLAAKSGVSYPTIARLESSEGEIGGRADTASRIVTALETAGLEFTNGGNPGLKMKWPILAALQNLATYVRRNSDGGAPADGPMATPGEKANRKAKVEDICSKIVELAEASRLRPVRYTEFEGLLDRLHRLKAFPTNAQVSAVADAITQAENEQNRATKTIPGEELNASTDE